MENPSKQMYPFFQTWLPPPLKTMISPPTTTVKLTTRMTSLLTVNLVKPVALTSILACLLVVVAVKTQLLMSLDLDVYTLYTVYILSLFSLAYIFICHCLATTLLWVVVNRYTPYLIITGTPLTFASTYCLFSLHKLLCLFRAPSPLVL